MDKKIKVMIADDQVILAEGIKSVLETDPELEVIGLAFDGFDALEKMEKNPPDVVLMDIRMPNRNGVAVSYTHLRGRPRTSGMIRLWRAWNFSGGWSRRPFGRAAACTRLPFSWWGTF